MVESIYGAIIKTNDAEGENETCQTRSEQRRVGAEGLCKTCGDVRWLVIHHVRAVKQPE